MRRVVALLREGAARVAVISDLTALPLPATRGLDVDSILEFVGRLDIGGAPIRTPLSGVVLPDGVGDGFVFVRRYPGRSGTVVFRRTKVGCKRREAL